MSNTDVLTGSGKSAPNKIRVLVAEDHDDSRILVQTFLSLLGFSVQTTGDGAEALRIAEGFRPDVIFLDIWMPVMGGVEACQRLREQPWAARVPIYGMTADPGQLERAAGVFDRTLLKPLDLEQFAELAQARERVLTGRARELH